MVNHCDAFVNLIDVGDIENVYFQPANTDYGASFWYSNFGEYCIIDTVLQTFLEWALEYHDPFCILCTNWFGIKSKYGVHSPHICIVIFVDNKWDGREYIFIIIIAIFPTISHQVLNHNHQPSSSLPLPLPLLLLNNIIIIIIFILISLVSCTFPSHAVFPSWQGLQMVEHKLNCIENCRNINTQVLKTRGSTGKHNTHWITVGFLVLSMYCGGVGQVEWW